VHLAEEIPAIASGPFSFIILYNLYFM